jgi:hypothetical protein
MPMICSLQSHRTGKPASNETPGQGLCEIP